MKTKIIAFVSTLLLSYSCTGPTNQVVVTPSPTPTPTLIPISTPTPMPTSTPVATGTPQVSASANVIVENTPSPSVIPTPLPAVTPTPSPVFIQPVKTNNILFDTSAKPFKGNSLNEIPNLTKLTALLTKEKYNVIFDNYTNQDLNNIDTIVIVSPYVDYSDADIEKLKNFTAQGKKVFILGEWGGYGGFSTFGINKFLAAANLKINEDVIKETQSTDYDFSDEQLFIKNFLVHPTNSNISTIAMYSSASIDIIDINKSNAVITAQTTSNSFRVMATSKFGVIGAAQLGFGKVVVCGDASIILDNDTNGNSISNIDEYDNTKFILNVLKW